MGFNIDNPGKLHYTVRNRRFTLTGRARIKQTKRLPVGVSDFKDIVTGNYCYVDKTLFIKELIDKGAKILLITLNPVNNSIVTVNSFSNVIITIFRYNSA
ncbi:MAG: AAA family ATPase [bacterium]|nr:AAA family ATPase [bacterium]